MGHNNDKNNNVTVCFLSKWTDFDRTGEDVFQKNELRCIKGRERKKDMKRTKRKREETWNMEEKSKVKLNSNNHIACLCQDEKNILRPEWKDIEEWDSRKKYESECRREK